MKTCNDRKEERGGRKESEREQALEGCVCVCAKAKQWQMSLLTFFAPSSKTSLHPGPAPFDAVLPTATLAPPSPLARPLPALDYDANNDIYIFYLPT